MKKERRGKPPVILIFGEDDNDQESLRWLMRSLRPDLPRIEKRRKPPVLVKGRENAKARKNALDISKVVRASNVRLDVKLVIAEGSRKDRLNLSERMLRRGSEREGD